MAGTQGAFVQPDPASDPFPMSSTQALGPVDKTGFGESVSRYVPVGGEWKDAGTDLTDGQGGVIRLTAKRAQHVNLRTSAGVEAGTPTQPVNSARVDGQKASYVYVNVFAPGNSPSDIAVLQGSATKTVKITRVRIQVNQTVAAALIVALFRRSTANAGGTSAAMTGFKMDTTDAAATAAAIAYTVAPVTPGTVVGVLRDDYRLVPTTASDPIQIEWLFDAPGCRQPTLRGVADFFTINFSGGVMAGATVGLTIETTEE